MTPPVKVLVDSTAGIQADLARRWGVDSVPLYLTFGERSFRDGLDLPPADFYAQLAHSPANPTTNAPNPADFAAACRAALDAGHEQVLIVTVTPNMSAAYAHARLAAAEIGLERVVVLDSGQGAGAQALIAAHAARVAASGAHLPQVVAAAEAACQRTAVWVMVDTLKYLRRSGRITGPQAALGELIQMKPILTFVSHRLQVVAKPRTQRRAAAWLVEQLAQRQQAVEQVLVMYADRPQAAADLAERVGQQVPRAEVDLSPVSYVVGGHTGPGLLGLAARWRA